MSSVSSPPPAGSIAPGAPRAGTALALALLAAVLVIASRSETAEVGPRTGRQVELVELIRVEQARAAEMEQRVEELTEQVSAQETRSSVGAATLASLQRQISTLEVPAGMTAVSGPGL